MTVRPFSLRRLLSAFSPLYSLPGKGIAGQGISVAVIEEYHTFLSILQKVPGQDLRMGRVQQLSIRTVGIGCQSLTGTAVSRVPVRDGLPVFTLLGRPGRTNLGILPQIIIIY